MDPLLELANPTIEEEKRQEILLLSSLLYVGKLPVDKKLAMEFRRSLHYLKGSAREVEKEFARIDTKYKKLIRDVGEFNVIMVEKKRVQYQLWSAVKAMMSKKAQDSAKKSNKSEIEDAAKTSEKPEDAAKTCEKPVLKDATKVFDDYPFLRDAEFFKALPRSLIEECSKVIKDTDLHRLNEDCKAIQLNEIESSLKTVEKLTRELLQMLRSGHGSGH